MQESGTLHGPSVAGGLKGLTGSAQGDGDSITGLWSWVLLVSRLCLFLLPCWNVGRPSREGDVSSAGFS